MGNKMINKAKIQVITQTQNQNHCVLIRFQSLDHDMKSREIAYGDSAPQTSRIDCLYISVIN